MFESIVFLLGLVLVKQNCSLIRVIFVFHALGGRIIELLYS